MHRVTQLVILILSLTILAGCSVQKRTLMPGYHVEWGGEHHLMETTDAPAEKLTSLNTTLVQPIPAQSLAVGVSPTAKKVHIPKQIAALPRIAPKAMLVSTAQAELQDPTPWARTYEAQKKFGNTALLAFGLAVLLLTTGAPQAALVMALVVGAIAFFLNRRKRREVLDLKELNGYDVTEERRQFGMGNRLLGGAVLLTIIAYIVLGIVTALAFWALIDAIFIW